MRALAFAVLSLSVVPLLACAPSGGGDAGPDAGPSDYDVYAPGITKQGERLRFTLVETAPGAPIRMDLDNTWTVLVKDEGGAPVEGLSVWLSPFMPDHDHGTSPPDFDGVPTANPGEHEIGPFALPMPGDWEFTVTAEDEAGERDDAMFNFYIEA